MLMQEIFGPDQKKKLQGIAGQDAAITVASYPYHLLIYIDEPVACPIMHLSGEAERRSAFQQYPLFSTVIKDYTHLDFDEALFLTTLFPIDPEYFLDEKKQQVRLEIPVPAIREFLSATRQLLLYAHQLEQLYCMLTGKPYNEAISFRKDWNLKRPSSRERAAKLSFTREFTLLDLLTGATFGEHQFVYNANFQGAYCLAAYANVVQRGTR